MKLLPRTRKIHYPAQVVQQFLNGIPINEIARNFQVNRHTIKNILKGKSYQWDEATQALRQKMKGE